LQEEKERYMRMALSLAKKGEGKVSPNPMVGAVIVKNGRIVGKGYHRYFGGPHAEVEAIKNAGEKAKGSILFVSLEPCCHFGKTPPCTQAIIKAGIKKVIAATYDPNPLNQGKGLKILREAGVETEVGICEKEAEKINRPFFKFIQEKIPYITVKAAASLDGKIATFKRNSKWITSEKSRKLGKRLRDKVDAILVGINTVAKDDPELLPLKSEKRYYRIILDTKLRISLKAKVLGKQALCPTLIFTTPHADENKIKALKQRDVKVRIVEEKEGKVNLRKVLEELGRMGVASCLVEGGGEVIASFIEENLVDKIFLFLSPCIIGGEDAPTWVEGRGFGLPQEAQRIRVERIRRIDEDILIEGYIEKKSKAKKSYTNPF